MAEGQYRILKAQLPLLGGVAGHNFLVLVGPDGRIVDELNGLATDAIGNVKPIGNLPSDTLKVHSGRRFYQLGFPTTEVVSGDQAKIMNLWNAASAAGDKINGLNLHYPFMGLGQNSNSVFSTLLAAIGLPEPPMAGGAPIMPGAGSTLLSPDDVSEIQHQFNLEVPSPDNVDDGTARPPSSENIGQPDQRTRPGALGLRRLLTPPEAVRIPPSHHQSFGAPAAKSPRPAIPGAKGSAPIGSLTGKPVAPHAPPAVDEGPDPEPQLDQMRSPWPSVPLGQSGLRAFMTPPIDDSQAKTMPPFQGGAVQFDVNSTNVPLPAMAGPDTSLTAALPSLLKSDRVGRVTVDDWKGDGPLSSLNPSAAPPVRTRPGGILGMLTDTGYIDGDGSDWLAVGGLPGLLQAYMRQGAGRGERG